MTRDDAGRRLFRTSPVMLHFCFFQQAVHARFRCQIYALVCQRRHDLARRKTGEFVAVDDDQYLPALRFAELIAGRRTNVRRAAIGGDDSIAATHPTLERADTNIKFDTSTMEAAASRYRFAYQRDTPQAIWDADQSSASSPQIAWAFFRKTSKAATSANAFSLRINSFSNTRMRF